MFFRRVQPPAGDRRARGRHDRVRHATERTGRTLERRLPLSEAGPLLRKAFPDHWSFLLGELALYSFVVLVLTGIYLTLFFQPGMDELVYHGSYVPLQGVRMSRAYESTLHISFDVRGGLLVRQAHHWAALVFVTAIGMHLLRIFFTGAFRRPREVNWTIGVTLFMLALAEGFAGYSLPDDLLSGTGLRIAQGVILSIPVVGTYLSMFAFGGQFPGHDIIPRLYGIHILLLPGLLLALITVHLMLVFYHKHTQWAGPGRTNANAVGKPLFPQFTATSGGLSLMLFGIVTVLSGVAQINPIWTYGPYRPDQVSTESQPDWYVGFLEGSLRLMPPWETSAAGHTFMGNVLVPAVLLPVGLFAVLYAYPVFERWITGDGREHHLCDRPRDRPTRTGLGVAGIVFYVVLLVAGGNDVVARTFTVSLTGITWALRGALVILPVFGFLVAKRVCLALQESDRHRLLEGDETGEVSQSVEGGYQEGHRTLDPVRRYVLLHRDVPKPLEAVPEQRAASPRRRRRARLRLALSSWYYRDRVEMPAPAEAERAAAERAEVERGSSAELER